MNITATLTSSLGTIDLPDIEVSFGKSRVDMVIDKVTLSNRIHTYFSPDRKREWSLPYSFMDEATYQVIESFFNNQFTTNDYPTISIPHYGVTDVPVRMYLNDMEVVDDCGTIRNIKLSFREK